jgi:hypothetical protein
MTDPIRDELHRLSEEFKKLVAVEETTPEQLVQRFRLTLDEAKEWLENEPKYPSDVSYHDASNRRQVNRTSEHNVLLFELGPLLKLPMLQSASLNRTRQTYKMRKKEADWGNFLFKKIVILGIVSLAAIAVALMPSPGNLLYPQAPKSLTSAPKSTGTVAQISAQDRLTFEPSNGAPANLASPQPVAQPTSQPAIKTDPGPVYTNVTIEPESVTVTVDQTFQVEIWINNVTGMAGWQIILVWNRQILKCVQAHVNTPPEWGGVGFDWFNKTVADVDPDAVYTAWQFGPGIENDFDATHGHYSKAECWGPHGGPYQNALNGSIAIVTLTFQALQAGSTSLYFSKDDYNSIGGYYEGMIIGNGDAQSIAHTDCEGFVDVQAP